MRSLSLLTLPLTLAAFVAGLGALAATPGCSSKQGTSDTGGGGISGTPQNQDADGGGVVYPTAHLGTSQRGLNQGVPETIPGSVIPNYKFLGYPDSDMSKGLQTVSLSDYYDPTASKHKLLHIIAAAEWCGPCNSETSAILTALTTPATDYQAQGVVYLEALVEGNAENVGATQMDLNAWIGKEHTTFAEVLDPEASELGEFFQAAAVPFNADIDVRDMEVLQAGVGGAEDPSSVTVWLDWVSKNPPAYAAP